MFYRYGWIFFILFWNDNTYGQHHISIIVNDRSQHKAANIYITGNFNNWNPAESQYALLKTDSNKWIITLNNIPAGIFSYKFTQGQWEKEETTAEGNNIDNHTKTITKNDTFQINIYGWKEKLLQIKKHTASKNVYSIRDSFYIPQLNRYRKIAVYLPSNYNSSNTHYPVLYMHDGQNLFNDYTAAFGEWGIDEALDTIQKGLGESAIVVAIDNGNEKRIAEYNFENHPKYGLAEGKQYVDFLAKVLKPYIDKKYRTKRSKKFTAIAGSSLGALISTYAVIKYPQTFGTVGIFSPAFWIAPSIDSLSKYSLTKTANRFWFYAGEKESADMLKDMERVKNNLKLNPINDISFNVDAKGEHNEKSWRKWFPAFYNWWMSGIKKNK